MICSRCDSANSAGRSHCLRCGALLSMPPLGSPAASSRPSTGALRWRVVLPCALIGVALLFGGYARWRTVRAASEPQAQPETAAVSAQDQQRINEALKRVPLVNARANDLMRAEDIKGALKLVDEVLAIVEAPDLLETKVNLLMKAKRYHEAYELLLLLLKQRDPPHLQFLAGQLAQTTKGAAEAML